MNYEKSSLCVKIGKGGITMEILFNTYMPVNLISGKECLSKNKEILKSLGDSCLIVTGSSSAIKSGVLSELEPLLSDAGIRYEIYNKIEENPKTLTCCAGGKAARDMGAKYIIGIGGGSALDAAKAVAIYATNENLISDDIYTSKTEHRPLPLILIGTTAGTGSEVTGVSVLTKENGRKQSISGTDFYAKYVFADSRYSYSLPYISTLSTALDAFCHATEGFFSKKADYLSRIYSLEAIKILTKELLLLSKRKDIPNERSRDLIYPASILAGLSINKAGTCFPHGMSYALTEDYLIPHGLACAVFLPAFLEQARIGCPDIFDAYLKETNLSFEDLYSLLSSMAKVNIYISDEKIEEYRKRWDGLKNFKNSPTDFDHNDAAALVKSLFSA
mgnify:CR=1 FL=1